MNVKSIELVCENCDVFKFNYNEFVQLYVDELGDIKKAVR